MKKLIINRDKFSEHLGPDVELILTTYRGAPVLKARNTKNGSVKLLLTFRDGKCLAYKSAGCSWLSSFMEFNCAGFLLTSQKERW